MSTSSDLFNSLLQESLKEENFKMEEQNNSDNVCLITGEPLTDKYITLVCNHTFNYIPLMNERGQWIKNYKNNSYCYKNKINLNTQLVCPYCRTVTDGILPWFSEVNGVSIIKKRGVNWPKKNWYLNNTCCYQFVSGKRKGQTCDKKSYRLLCTQHEKHKDKYDENGKLLPTPKKKSSSPTFSCSHILIRGKRKGQCCGKTAKARKHSETGYIYYHCSSHYKKYLYT